MFGDDYPTKDGTGMRDYLHVVDLAKGHLAALNYIRKKDEGCYTFNLGTGTAYSVLEMLKGMSEASGRELPYVIGPRRAGDLAEIYADPAVAKKELGWVAEKGLKEMCDDAWRWQKQNPNGYGK